MTENNEQLLKQLEQKREEVYQKRIKLLNEFREYALNKLREIGKTLEVKYTLINGKNDIDYNDLKTGEKFTFEQVTFMFNLQTELIHKYVKRKYRLTKKEETFEQLEQRLSDEKENKDIEVVSTIRKMKQNLSTTNEFETQKIIEKIQKETDSLLNFIFRRQVKFEDAQYYKLAHINIALLLEHQKLEQEIKELKQAPSKKI